MLYILISGMFYYISELGTFRLFLARYHSELNSIEQIVEEQALGILHLWFNRFKEAVLPSPTELLSVVQHTLSWYVPKNLSARFLYSTF
jgi:hypothetical protein